NGGDGWLRIMRFNVPFGRIDFESYSPYLDQYRYTDESLFTLDVDFDAHRTLDGFAAFQQGVNGYDGTRDTWIDEDEPDRSYGEDDTRDSDDDTANSIFTDYRGQALVRFDGLFDAEDEFRIPPGATIRRATLILDIASDIDNPFADPRFFIHPVLVPWQEDSTWNSLGGGLSEGDDIGPAIGSFLGDNVPNSDTMRRTDITGLVQAWSNGQPNWGVAILPEIIGGNDEGISIWTSESGNPLLRPRLEVVFEQEPVSPSPDLNGDGVVDSGDLGLLIASWNAPGPNPADLDGDGSVGPADLGILISAWGPYSG
ncbi:MAG: DNRLRE domain-containing protein, partial [Planctomycetota bacterium]|nr:DNRLRE domain-containing protein [Planctomycetota bacterium]